MRNVALAQGLVSAMRRFSAVARASLQASQGVVSAMRRISAAARAPLQFYYTMLQGLVSAIRRFSAVAKASLQAYLLESGDEVGGFAVRLSDLRATCVRELCVCVCVCV